MEQIGWGILATGNIAHSFARDLLQVPGARLAAVGSRSAERAAAFAGRYAGPEGRANAYGSYAELVEDPGVDVVYIATPHALHLDDARLALEAGKHVLCEKPLTLDVAQAEEMIEVARAHDRFLMEAMWTACHPVVRELAAGIRAGRFGTPRQLHSELGFRSVAGPEHRLFDPTLGASALLDMGIYPLTIAHLLLGEAEELRAIATLSDRGIDLDIAITGRYPGGALGTFSASLTSWSSAGTQLATDAGRIEFADSPHPPYATFVPYANRGHDGGPVGDPVRIEGSEPILGVGYGNEIAEVHRCLREGLRESPLVPHAQTLTILRQMDDLRSQVGVEFPASALD